MYRCGLSRWEKSILIFLIVAILANIHPVGISILNNTCLNNAFLNNAFKKTIAMYLNYQTRSFAVLDGDKISLKYSQKDNDIAPFMLAIAEEYYLQVKDRFNVDPSDEKVLVIVYPDEASLNNSQGLKGDRSAVGVYWAGSIGVLSPYAMLAQGAAQKDVEQVFIEEGPLVHELTHYLVDEQTEGNYVRWLTEGLAQYLEKEITGYSLEPPRWESRRQLYSLSSLDRDFDKKPDGVLAYWQSLLTVTYLIEEHGIEKIQELLTVLGQGTAFEQAFLQVYRFSLAALEDAVRIYVTSELNEGMLTGA